MQKLIFQKYIDSKKTISKTNLNYQHIITNHKLLINTDAILFFNIETSGKPIRKSRYEQYHHYKDIKKYDTSRITDISWIITDKDGKKLATRNYTVKPSGFKLQNKTKMVFAQKNGVKIEDIFDALKNDLTNVKFIVAHDIKFNLNILMSEFYRYDRDGLIKIVNSVFKICTKDSTQKIIEDNNLDKLYELCFDKNEDEECEECEECQQYISKLEKIFFFLRDNYNLFKETIGKYDIQLNEQQLAVVNEDITKNILIVACAGSGKTTTIIHRIKYLVQKGIDPESIILTTFTRDASQDMKKKLKKIFGYDLPIEVGTIDSISRRNLIRFGSEFFNQEIVNVGEYGPKFLKFLKDDPNKDLYLCDKKYLFVDEFQDINDTQSNIITEFYKNGVKIIAVGDDAQNIYSFRGSNIQHILNFDKIYENVVKHKLIVNYRSTPEIIKLANESIENNKIQIPKKMVPFNESINKLPEVEFFWRTNYQNEALLEDIQYYMTLGIDKHEIAVLCRMNGPLKYFESLLSKHKISHVLLDGEGDVRTKIKEDHICLSTIHKSKGLEWDVVFIIGVNDGIFPSGKNPLDIEEDRRLFYVAITRAKRYLHMFFTPFGKIIYVTRFISELDQKLINFDKYDPKFIGLSDTEYSDYDLSVTELIRNLDGDDYEYLKENEIFPKLDFTKRKLYKSYDYHDFIKDNDIYSDFGVFIDCLISRMIGQVEPKSNGLLYESALLAIINLKLDKNEWVIYKKYKLNFIHNLDKIKDGDTNATIIDKLETFNAIKYYIDGWDYGTLTGIVHKLFAQSKKFNNVPIYKIPIISMRFLPEDFEDNMEKELKNFTNPNKNWKDIIRTIWEISKCDKIVKENRRRMLYKKIETDDIMKYSELYDNIWKKYVSKLQYEDIKCHKSVRMECGVFGEIDMLLDNTIVDFKTSCDYEPKAEWILQVLCYAYMANLEDNKINRIEIFNPFHGLRFFADISGWNKGLELIEYLLEKRQKLIDRTKTFSDNYDAERIKVDEYVSKKAEERKNKKVKVVEDETEVPSEFCSEYGFIDD